MEKPNSLEGPNPLREPFHSKEQEPLMITGFQCQKCGATCAPDVVGIIHFCPFCGVNIIGSNIISFHSKHRSNEQKFCPTCGKETSLEEMRESVELLKKDFPYQAADNPTVACPECLPKWMIEDPF